MQKILENYETLWCHATFIHMDHKNSWYRSDTCFIFQNILSCSFLLFSSFFLSSVIILSILLFGLTTFAYAYYKDLRDFKGKAIVGLMMSQILAYSTYSIMFLSDIDFDSFRIPAFLMGLLQILLWTTVIVVNQFIVFK